MLLDNWLSQRAQTCPDRCALIADGVSLTYAELEREATRSRAPARGAGRAPRRDGRAAHRRRASSTSSLMHALMKLGAVAYPINTRLGRGRDRGGDRARQPAADRHGSPDLGLTEADLPLLGEHDLGGARTAGS